MSTSQQRKESLVSSTEDEDVSDDRDQLFEQYRQQRVASADEYNNTGYIKDYDKYQVNQKKWPFLLWIYLKSLGLYHEAPFVTVRRCNQCKEIGHEQFTTAQSFKLHQCQICESFLWDHEGRISYITDEDIGATRLNHRFSFILSNLWLFLIFASTLFLFIIDLLRYEDKEDDLVETMSTICLQLLLTIPVLSAIACNFNSAWPHCAPGKWASSISPIFLVQRLRWVNMRKTRTAGYVLFFGSIFFITLQCTQVTQDLYAYGKKITYVTPIDYFTIVTGIFNFAGMAYVVYLLRRSFEKEVRLVCKFTKDNIDEVDLCRYRLAETFDTFHQFREFTSGWMSMNIIFAIISFLLEIHVWITATTQMPYFRYERIFFLMTCFLLPILAIGNVSVDYLWGRLVRQISRMRNSEKEFNWDKLMQFLQEQRPGNRPWQSVMAFILSIIAVFAAIQFRILSSKAVNNATNFNHLNITGIYDQ